VRSPGVRKAGPDTRLSLPARRHRLLAVSSGGGVRCVWRVGSVWWCGACAEGAQAWGTVACRLYVPAPQMLTVCHKIGSKQRHKCHRDTGARVPRRYDATVSFLPVRRTVAGQRLRLPAGGVCVRGGG